MECCASPEEENDVMKFVGLVRCGEADLPECGEVDGFLKEVKAVGRGKQTSSLCEHGIPSTQIAGWPLADEKDSG